MAEPRTFDDYVRLFQRVGRAPFQKRYARHILIGIGVVGRMDEGGRRGDEATFLAALYDQTDTAVSLQRRVWRLEKSPYGPPCRAVRAGRGAGNDVVIPEHTVSKTHCDFGVRGGKVVVMDLGAHNGTLVMGRPLRPRAAVIIDDGDELILGRYKFEFLMAQTFLTRVSRAADGWLGNLYREAQP